MTMGSFLSALLRAWRVEHPPEVPKSHDAIRIGVLGTGWIAERSLFAPAKSCADIIVAACASRDKSRAEVYAKKWNIPIGFGSYQAMLDDPSIDAIYNPLPNSEHYEWTIKALQAGKHVLLEKPSVSNATEAGALFGFYVSMPEPKPVLVEAFHVRFHPAWSKFLSLLSPPDIETVHTFFNTPAGFFPKDDVRWKFELSGGSLMDIGTYNIALLRTIFGTEPLEIVNATPRMSEFGDVDAGFKAEFRFPNRGTGFMDADCAKTSIWGLPGFSTPKIIVQQRGMEVVCDVAGETQTRTRKITFWNFAGPQYFHSIVVEDVDVRKRASDGKILSTTTEKQTVKAYEWDGKGKEEGREGEPYWSTYRHMLEQFVNRIKGRKGSGLWIEHEDSIKQMKIIDATLEKGDLALRPTTRFLTQSAQQ